LVFLLVLRVYSASSCDNDNDAGYRLKTPETGQKQTISVITSATWQQTSSPVEFFGKLEKLTKAALPLPDRNVLKPVIRDASTFL